MENFTSSTNSSNLEQARPEGLGHDPSVVDNINPKESPKINFVQPSENSKTLSGKTSNDHNRDESDEDQNLKHQKTRKVFHLLMNISNNSILFENANNYVRFLSILYVF